MLGYLGKSSIALTILTAISAATFPAQAALLVSSSGDNSIKQYDEPTGAYIRDFVSSGSGGLSNPQGLAIGPDGNLFVSSFDTSLPQSASSSSVKEYSGTTGEYIGDFVSSSNGLSAPRGLTFGTDGNLFVVSSNIPGTEINIPGVPVQRRSGVLQYDTTGQLVGSISTGSIGLPSGPQPIDVAIGGPDDNIFISQGRARSNSGFIVEYEPTTGTIISRDYTVSDPSVTSIGPGGLAITNNFLYYTDGSAVGRFDLVNNNIDPRFVSVNSGGLNPAVDVAIGENGNLLVSSFGTNSIKQYDSATGNFLGDLVTPSSGGLSRPTYLTTANVPVPEPSSVLGVMAFGGLFAGSVLRRKMSDRKQLGLLQK